MPSLALAPGFDAIRGSLGPGGRLGVAALEVGGSRRLGFDEDGGYAMCSTFKLLLAAQILRLADERRLKLTDELPFGRADLLDNSPISQANVRKGHLSIEALAAAIVRHSDNSAANLLLKHAGGPAALTRFLRATGDRTTRLDRYEMPLNSNLPGDPRDTTTPRAMAETTARLVTGDVLSTGSRARLLSWLETSVRFPDRLRGGLPRGWRVGHKPGTGRNGAHNDVAIAWPPGRPPIVIASYISGGTASPETRAAAHRSVGALIARRFG